MRQTRLRALQLLHTARKALRSEGIVGLLRRGIRWLRGERGSYRQIKPPIPTYTEFQQRFEPSITPATSSLPHFDIISPDAPEINYPAYTWHTNDDDLQGDYVLPVAAGDQLHPDALHLFAQVIQTTPNVPIIYADQDQIVEGKRVDPWFKPPATPENVLSANPLLHGCAIRRDLWRPGTQYARTLEIIREGYEAQHIPRVLLHRDDPAVPPVDWEAVCEHLRGYTLKHVRVEDDVLCWQPSARVSIIIPSRDNAALLSACLGSIRAHTTQGDYELIIVDNGSTDPATFALYEGYQASYEPEDFRVVRYDQPFNFSAACNLGAAHATGDLLLFLNNDTEVLTNDWLPRLAQWFALPGVGAVGPRLLYPDRKVQHGGVVIGLNGAADHLFAFAEQNTTTLYGGDDWYRNLSAVTGACLLTSREAFDAVGGFDACYRLMYSDIEYCLRLHEAGLRIVYTPHPRIIHHESKTHRRRVPPADLARVHARLKPYLHTGDPFYHPYLTTRWQIPALRIEKRDRAAQYDM
jgi:O-antigen biosynthesis protein